MKNTNRFFKNITIIIILVLMNISCEKDFENLNSATDDEILKTPDGLLSLATGIKQLYSTSGLRLIVETPAITTREAASTSTFLTLIELEDGGAIVNDNSNIQSLWSTLYRLLGMSENLYSSVDKVTFAAGTASGL